jgi:hypothetical protein
MDSVSFPPQSTSGTGTRIDMLQKHSQLTVVQEGKQNRVLLYDTYLTQGGSCCIGGYHSSEGSVSNPQSYAEAAYVDHVGAFSQDVSALSHEIGEWADDPLTDMSKAS